MFGMFLRKPRLWDQSAKKDNGPTAAILGYFSPGVEELLVSFLNNQREINTSQLTAATTDVLVLLLWTRPGMFPQQRTKFSSSLGQHGCFWSFLLQCRWHRKTLPWHLTDSHSMHTIRPTLAVASPDWTYEPAYEARRRPLQQSEASGHTLGRALLRGIRPLVWLRRRVQEVTAHIQGEGQEAAVQVHHHVLLKGAEGGGAALKKVGEGHSHENQ